MKKLMCAMGAIALCGAVIAGEDNSITSANVVGYISCELKAGKMDILGTQFVNVGADALDIQSIKLSNYTEGMDVMMVYTPGVGYENYFYFSDTIDNDVDWNSMGEGWGDAGSVRSVNVTLDPGQGFWLATQKDVTATIPGQVLLSGSETMEIKAGKMDIMASPYPCATDIQNVTLANYTEGMDVMMVYTPGVGYENYFYFSDTIDNDVDWNSMGEGWGDAGSVRITGVELNPGQGFWLATQADCTVTIKNPSSQAE